MTLPWDRGPLRACLFDFGGTLDSDGATWQDRFFRLYCKHGISVDREAFRQAFYRSDDSLIETGVLREAGLQETLERQVDKVLGALAVHSEKQVGKWIVADFLGAMQETIRRNRPLLEELRHRFRLGVVSNFYGNLEKVCSDLGIRDLFDCLVDSSLEGVMKPAPGIFLAALERLGVLAGEAVFIGDNVCRDMEGAKGVGMPHIWLAGESGKDARPCCPDDPVIRSLADVVPLLLNGWESTQERAAS